MNKTTQSVFHSGSYSGWDHEPQELAHFDKQQSQKITQQDIARIEKALKKSPLPVEV